ncbi:hypothetical protein AB4254_11790 [Vibrio breoganii]
MLKKTLVSMTVITALSACGGSSEGRNPNKPGYDFVFDSVVVEVDESTGLPVNGRAVTVEFSQPANVVVDICPELSAGSVCTVEPAFTYELCVLEKPEAEQCLVSVPVVNGDSFVFPEMSLFDPYSFQIVADTEEYGQFYSNVLSLTDEDVALIPIEIEGENQKYIGNSVVELKLDGTGDTLLTFENAGNYSGAPIIERVNYYARQDSVTSFEHQSVVTLPVYEESYIDMDGEKVAYQVAQATGGGFDISEDGSVYAVGAWRNANCADPDDENSMGHNCTIVPAGTYAGMVYIGNESSMFAMWNPSFPSLKEIGRQVAVSSDGSVVVAVAEAVSPVGDAHKALVTYVRTGALWSAEHILFVDGSDVTSFNFIAFDGNEVLLIGLRNQVLTFELDSNDHLSLVDTITIDDGYGVPTVSDLHIIDENRFVIGSADYTFDGVMLGGAFLYEDGEIVHTFKPASVQEGDRFGAKVSASADGTKIYVSAPLASEDGVMIMSDAALLDEVGYLNAGKVIKFEETESGWVDTHHIYSVRPEAGAEFGTHFEVNGANQELFIAAPGARSATDHRLPIGVLYQY